MIIEFIGTPGAGKTTLLPTVAEYFLERDLHAFTVVEAARPCAQRTWLGKIVTQVFPREWQPPLLWQLFCHLSTCHALLFSLAHPRLIYQVLSSQLQRPIPLEARHHALYWFFRLTGYSQFISQRARPDEVLLLDEGFVHRVVQMHASACEVPDAGRIAAYLDLVPRPDLVIAVHAPWEICLDRIYRRGLWKRYRTKGRAEVTRYVHNAHRVVNLAIDHMRSMGWALLELDNGGDDCLSTKEDLRYKLARLSPRPHSEDVVMRTREGAWIG
jgi:thymidylate kinase